MGTGVYTFTAEIKPTMLESVKQREADQAEELYNLSAIQVPDQTEFPISEKELISKLKISRSLISALRSKKEIPFIKAGARILYQASKVIAALEVSPNTQNT